MAHCRHLDEWLVPYTTANSRAAKRATLTSGYSSMPNCLGHLCKERRITLDMSEDWPQFELLAT